MGMVKPSDSSQSMSSPLAFPQAPEVKKNTRLNRLPSNGVTACARQPSKRKVLRLASQITGGVIRA